MGKLSDIVGGNLEEGGHAVKKSDIFQALSDQLDPTSQIQWQTNSPTVVRDVRPATLAEADAAEKAASEYEAGVEHGVRLLKAEGKRQKAHAKLVRGHRQYLGTTAQAHFEANAANRGLAGKMLGLREQYAQLGYSLERKVQTTDAKVEQIKHRLLG